MAPAPSQREERIAISVLRWLTSKHGQMQASKVQTRVQAQLSCGAYGSSVH